MKANFRKEEDTEAAESIRRRAIVHGSVMKTMLPEIRARAFAVASLQDLSTVAKIQEVIAQVPEGKSWSEIKKHVDNYFATELNPEKSARKTKALISRETMKAFSAARYMELTDPGELELFPYWEYKAIGDSRTRPSHKALDGVCLSADDPFWLDHYPPWDWGCRCTVVQVSKAGADIKRKNNDPKFIEGGRKLKDLHNGIIKTPQGGDVNISSPEALEIKAFGVGHLPKAFRNNPADLSLDIGEIRESYQKNKQRAKLFDIFAEKMHNKTVKFERSNGSSIPIWDWLCESEIRLDARAMLHNKGKECVILRSYADNSLIEEVTGEKNKATYNVPDKPFTIIHSHPADSAFPSLRDLADMLESKPAYSTITSLRNGKISRYRIKDETAIINMIDKWRKIVDPKKREMDYPGIGEDIRKLIKVGIIDKEDL